MVVDELLHNANTPRMVCEACEVASADMGILES